MDFPFSTATDMYVQRILDHTRDWFVQKGVTMVLEETENVMISAELHVTLAVKARSIGKQHFSLITWYHNYTVYKAVNCHLE